MTYLVAFIDKLMSTSNELKAIDVIELRSHFVSKQPACASWRHSPSSNILRITPHQIAEGTLVGYFLRTGNDTDLIEGTYFRTQTAVNAENFAINDCTENEKIEDLAAGFPY